MTSRNPEQRDHTYPCLIVKGNDIRIIGTGLLRDGRYELVRVDKPKEDQ